MMQGASDVSLHNMPLSSMLLVQQESCKRAYGRDTRLSDLLKLRSGNSASAWVNTSVELRLSESPPRSERGGHETATDTNVPRHQAARCNLRLRRFRTELRSRCCRLAHQARRCYKLFRTYRCIRRGIEETTPTVVLRCQDIVSINSTKRSKTMISPL